MSRAFKLDLFDHILPVMSLVVTAGLAWIFATRSGWVYWATLLGYPVLCCLVPLVMFLRTRHSNYGGVAAGAMVSSIVFSMLIGFEVVEWVLAYLFG